MFYSKKKKHVSTNYLAVLSNVFNIDIKKSFLGTKSVY